MAQSGRVGVVLNPDKARAVASRPSASERGYDAEYRRKRKRIAREVATGTVRCWRCGELIPAGEPWHLGHDDRNRSIIRGPEHVKCNTATRSHMPPRSRPAEQHPGMLGGGDPPRRGIARATAGIAARIVYGFRGS